MNWYENAVMYHIYPLGFCGAPKHNEGGEPVNRLEKVLPAAECGIVNGARYRTRTIPAAGALLKPEDSEEKQLELL